MPHHLFQLNVNMFVRLQFRLPLFPTTLLLYQLSTSLLFFPFILLLKVDFMTYLMLLKQSSLDNSDRRFLVLCMYSCWAMCAEQLQYNIF